MATTVVSRENIMNWALDSSNLYWFRRALEEMQGISAASQMDERGYQWVAGVHGGFGGQPYCEHGTLNFLTWHRPYILDIELKLRDQIRKLADADTADEWRLPYWDWAAANAQGLPQAFTDATYDDNGTSKPNPLLAMPYDLPYNPGVSDAVPWPTTTFRNPRSVSNLQSLRAMVESALEEPDFSYFSRAIERPHNSLHGWVLGYMATYRSSFDPIFWLHHCNVDRQFWLWQERYGNSSIPDSIRTFTCQPFKFQDNRSEAFLDTRTLGYTYAESRQRVTAATARPELDASTGDDQEPLPDTLSVSMGSIDHEFERARLHFHGVEHPNKTHEIRVFANRQTVPDLATPSTDAENFLGAHVILGHGECPGAPGHCDRKALAADGLRREHHLSPFDMFIDISAGLKALAAAHQGGAGLGELTLFFVVVDSMSDKQVSNSVLKFENLSITTR